jgi:quinol monooxygenase YgiN
MAQFHEDQRRPLPESSLLAANSSVPASTISAGLLRLPVVAVIVVADMFGISGRPSELVQVLRRSERQAGAESGCRRYTFAAALSDPDRFVRVGEWDSQEALDAHYGSREFAAFQFDLDGLLARPSEMTAYLRWRGCQAGGYAAHGPPRRRLSRRPSRSQAPTQPAAAGSDGEVHVDPVGAADRARCISWASSGLPYGPEPRSALRTCRWLCGSLSWLILTLHTKRVIGSRIPTVPTAS